jgi:hypothetical protein
MLHRETHSATRPFAWSSVIGSSLMIALFPIMLAGCSPKRLTTQIPVLPAALAQPCPSIPAPPAPLIDPDRSVWELALIAAYGDCAARHSAAVKAWPN